MYWLFFVYYRVMRRVKNMNKIVLSLVLLLLVFSCDDNGCQFCPNWVIEPGESILDFDGAINDCNYPEQMYDASADGWLGYSSETVSGWNITPETVCCCNSDASNYSEDGWNCDSEDDTYCVFD